MRRRSAVYDLPGEVTRLVSNLVKGGGETSASDGTENGKENAR